MALLQKMGWKPGEGLGKNKEGTLQPLLLEVKMDKKGKSAICLFIAQIFCYLRLVLPIKHFTIIKSNNQTNYQSI